MRDRIGLFSREQRIELAITLAIAMAVGATSRFEWFESGRWRGEVALLVALYEVVFAFTKTRHISRQFAPREQTEWFLTAGATDRARLSRAYVISLVWRAAYHTALVGSAAVAAQLIPNELSRPKFFVVLMAWQCVVRAIVATYRHIAGSRIVPRLVRATLEPAAPTWWRFPAQLVLTVSGAAAIWIAFLVLRGNPELVLAAAIGGALVVYGLARSSESVEPVTEIAVHAPWLVREGRPVAKSCSNELLGLLWIGSRPWWRWAYLPIAFAMLALIAVAPRLASHGRAATGFAVTLGAIGALWLLSVLATTYRVVWPRIFLALAAVVFTYFMIGFGTFTWLLLASRAVEADSLFRFARGVEALVLTSASLCAAAASPYRWESRGVSALHLRSIGVDAAMLRRIELLTGALLGAIAWWSLALVLGPAQGSVVGAPIAALCLLLQDRSTNRLGTRSFTWRDVTHAWLILFVLAGLVLAVVIDSARVPRLVVVTSSLIVFATVFLLWISSWRTNVARAVA